MIMVDRLIVIAQFANYIEAEMAKQSLADHGIKAVVTGVNASNVYSGMPAIERPALEVMESQAKEALEILESDKKQEE
jgi:hypothetical protein